jgi:hypothetical protein
MANTLSRNDVKRLALIGAQSRLESLRAEISTILRAFPELGRGGSVNNVASRTETPQRGRGGRGGRKRRNWAMSDAQKRAVSERMKKYWAGRRKEKAAKATAAKKA